MPNQSFNNNTRPQNGKFNRRPIQGIADRLDQEFGGPNFIEKMNVVRMTKAVIPIFRDIAGGRFNVEKYGNCFANRQFLETCNRLIWNEWEIREIYKRSLNSLIQKEGNTPVAYEAFNRALASSEAYYTILCTLTAIKETGDLKNLYILANKLNKYRENI